MTGVQTCALPIYRKVVEREIHISDSTADISDKEGYRHYMLKEIFFQADAISQTLKGRINNNEVIAKEFGESSETIFSKTKSIKIVACGTSYHAGLIAAYWMEKIANIHCQVEIASEFRYRRSVIRDDTLFVSIRSEEHTSELQSLVNLVCRLLLEKKKQITQYITCAQQL